MKSIFHFLFIFGGIVVFNYVDAAVDVCTLPIPVQNEENPEKMWGRPCLAFMQRYGYDYLKNECVLFIYGGCGINVNHYSTLSSCEKACKKNASQVANTDQ